MDGRGRTVRWVVKGKRQREGYILYDTQRRCFGVIFSFSLSSFARCFSSQSHLCNGALTLCSCGVQRSLERKYASQSEQRSQA